AAILKTVKSKYNVEMKIERLMNLKLNEDKNIISYTNRFDVCAKRVKNEVSNHEVKCWYLRGLPVKYREKVKQYYFKTYEETKNWAIKFKKYKKKANVIGEELTYQMNPDIDDLAGAFLKLNIRQ
ncbi:20361_t:CDS:2, partial [Racocetra persica]